MSIIIETKRYAACPECGGKVGSIDHLAGDDVQQAGPWSCKDCGRFWYLSTNGRDICDLKLSPRTRWMPATVTLILPPQKEAVVFTLHTHTHDVEGEEFGAGSKKFQSSLYYYDERTCPTNWMRDVAEIRIGDNRDPHGLFEFKKIKRGHLERDPMTGDLKHDESDEDDDELAEFVS